MREFKEKIYLSKHQIKNKAQDLGLEIMIKNKSPGHVKILVKETNEENIDIFTNWIEELTPIGSDFTVVKLSSLVFQVVQSFTTLE